jgi:hypothetical protein
MLFFLKKNGTAMIYPTLSNRKTALVAAGWKLAAGSAAALRAIVGAFRGDAIALGVEDDEAAWTFARAGRLQAGVAEEEMQHAALARVHGLEAEGLAGVLDFLYSSVSRGAKGAGTGGLEAVGVEGDAVVIVGLEAEHLGGKMFEGAEELAVVVKQQFGVGALALDIDVAAFEAVRIDGTGTGCNAVFEAKSTGGGEQPHQSGNLLSSLR